MHNRSMRDTVAGLKSRMFRAWTSGWSVPMDEIFVPARLPSRHLNGSGSVTEFWLRKSARSAALKWRDEVCAVRNGQIECVTIDDVEPLRQLSAGAQKALRVTARYCGRTEDGAWRFRHVISDVHGDRLMRYVSQVRFEPQPDLPAYPAVKVTAREAIERPA